MSTSDGADALSVLIHSRVLVFLCRARGIDDATARQVLVYSFGSEVTKQFKHELLLKRIQETINSTLAQASIL